MFSATLTTAPPAPGLKSDDETASDVANCTGTVGVCLHNAYPILKQLTATETECCGNCTANPKCVSWNVNTAMKACFLRGSYKPNPGRESRTLNTGGVSFFNDF